MFSGFRNASNDAPPPYPDQSAASESSLTTILPTQAHRIQCALLILLCSDALRKDVAATFELPHHMQKHTQSTRESDLVGLSPGTDENNHAAHTMLSVKRREEELALPDIQKLKVATLQYFDSWRAKVLRRVCDALDVRAEAIRVARKQCQAHVEKRKVQQEKDDLIQWAVDQEQLDGSCNEEPRYPPIDTDLLKLGQQQRVLLLECLVLLLLSLESYPAHSRILLLRITSSLRLDHSVLATHESTIARGLLSAAQQMSGEDARKARAAEQSAASKWKIGLATVGGAVLLGVTGGLAAPLVAAGLGTVFGGLGLGVVSTLLGALASNTLLIGGLFGAYGGKMTGEMVERYEKEVEDFKFLPIRHTLSDDPSKLRPSTSRTSSNSGEGRHKLRVAIGISGALTTESDMILPWSILDKDSVESFALRWEVVALLRLGISLTSVLKSYAWQYAKWEIARRTVFAAVAASLWPLGLLKMAKIIDNPFSIARVRADKAGKVLADALIDRCQGERPLTLIGFSIGARVIYSCLLELADRKAFGLVENVILMGAPVPSDSEPWTKLRSVVSGRVVNCFSTEDYILGFLYRASSAQINVAGLQTIDDVNGVENYNFSDSVSGHTRYRYMVGQILQKIGFEDVDASEVEKEYAILKALDNEEAEEQQRQPPTDEVAEIEARIRNRVGSSAQGAARSELNEQEERRRQELLRAAEERVSAAKGGPPPSYEDVPSKTPTMPAGSRPLRSVQISEATDQAPTDVAGMNAQMEAHSITGDHDEDELSDNESIHSGPLEMLHVMPVPESDDEEESSPSQNLSRRL